MNGIIIEKLLKVLDVELLMVMVVKIIHNGQIIGLCGVGYVMFYMTDRRNRYDCYSVIGRY
jgi:hypothetical protein